MPISTKLKDYLEKEGVPYQHHVHVPAYTAQEIAATAHVSGKELAKTVILKADDHLVMAVPSANDKVDLQTMKDEVACKTLRLATEEEFLTAFPTCSVGAMPPFGNIFGMPIYCDAALEQHHEIEFNAGTHYDSIRMGFEDFKRLANPRLLNLMRQSQRMAA